MNWVLAATFICGASVFTSCTANDANDNPSQEQAKENRKEFIKHTRENLKEVAENLNFSSWRIANRINQIFNTTVLNNPEFEKAIIPLFTQKIRESVKPVEEGSELAAMGYKLYATVDLTEFNYRFTMKENGSGFDVEEADDFEMIINTVAKEAIITKRAMKRRLLCSSFPLILYSLLPQIFLKDGTKTLRAYSRTMSR